MNFQQFLNEETRTANSAAVIKDVLDKVGMGLETVRQTQTKENRCFKRKRRIRRSLYC